MALLLEPMDLPAKTATPLRQMTRPGRGKNAFAKDAYMHINMHTARDCLKPYMANIDLRIVLSYVSTLMRSLTLSLPHLLALQNF